MSLATPPLVDPDTLDLGPIDLRNLDPATARRMLDDIKSGADIKVMIAFAADAPARHRQSQLSDGRRSRSA